MISIIIIIIVLFVIYFYVTYKNPNEERHLYDNNEYAHFSKLTRNNYWLCPKYIFTHPQKYILEKGDALYIPKNWWHWVFSYDNTFGVNYWWNDKVFFDNPKKFINFIKPIDLLDKNINKKVHTMVLGSENNQKFISSNLENYIKSNETDTYLITLNAFVNNTDFKNNMNNILQHPEFITNNNLNKNYNFWYCIKEKDTGLHQDDNFGLLCVLSGKKIVYLYPPSDRKYLNPYPLQPDWTNHEYEDLEFNIYKSNGFIKDVIPSSRILYETMRKNPKNNVDIKKIVTDIVTKMTNIFGFNKIIWEAICDKVGNISWKYYFHNLDKYRKSKYLTNNNEIFNKLKNIDWLNNFKSYDLESLKLNNTFSFEIHNNIEYKPTIDLCINMNKSIELPFYGKTYNYNGIDLVYKNSFILCELDHFIKNIDEILDYFEFNYLKQEILNELLQYNYVKLIAFFKNNNLFV